jgi:N-alpha-acetyltransferase 35, NatC auxiliary subunit
MSGAGGPRFENAQPFLATVCERMRLGELLHGENFSLFESMSAVEIGAPRRTFTFCDKHVRVSVDHGSRCSTFPAGDPKMDAGLLSTNPTADELIEQGAAPLHLDAAQTIAVVDRLLRLEALWHAGYPLAQTIFTSLYMLRPARHGTISSIQFATRCRPVCQSTRFGDR